MLSSFVILGKEIYSPNEVIRMVAEKEGGVHYDNELSERLAKLRQVVYSGQVKRLEEKLLIQTASVIVEFGKLFLLNKSKQSGRPGYSTTD